jgi:hypothetical protein
MNGGALLITNYIRDYIEFIIDKCLFYNLTAANGGAVFLNNILNERLQKENIIINTKF